MQLIADLVAKLIASGTPADVAATVVAEAFAAGVSASIPRNSADVSADNRREKDRIRKQLARGNPQKSADVRGIPQMSESASLSKSYSLEKKKNEREANRGCRLADEWTVPTIDWAIALELLGSDRAQGELAKFRDHWKQQPGAKGVKLDWSAAWRNWTRRAAEYGGKTNGNGTGAGTHPASNQSGSTSIIAGVAAATERRARERSAAGQQRQAPVDEDAAERSDPELFGAPRSGTPHH